MYKASKALAKALSEAVEERGRKEWLRKRAGVSASQIDGYIRAESSPSLDVICRLAAALDQEPWQLIMPAGEDAVPASKLKAAQARIAELEHDLAAAKRVLASALKPDETAAPRVLARAGHVLVSGQVPEELADFAEVVLTALASETPPPGLLEALSRALDQGGSL